MEEKLTAAQANMCGDCCNCTDKVCKDELYSELNSAVNYCLSEIKYWRDYLQAEVNWLGNDLNNHKKGHLPAILGAEKLKNALDTLGIGGDYVVEPRTIYSSETGKPKKLLLEFNLDK